MYLFIGGNKGNALGVVLFCYVIMLVSKLTLTTNTRALLFISKVLLFGYSRIQYDTVGNSHRASIERQSERVSAITPNSKKQP